MSSTTTTTAATTSERDLILTVFPFKSSSKRPRARCGHTMNSLDNTLYVFGGADEYAILGDFFACNIVTQHWEMIECSGFNVPSPRMGHSCTTGERRLFMFGGLTVMNTYSFKDTEPNNADDYDGFDLEQFGTTSKLSGNNNDSNRNFKYSPALNFRTRLFEPRGETTTNDLYVYDTDKKQWTQPIAKGEAPLPRFMHAAAYSNGKIWIFGGCKKPGYELSLNDLHCFDIESNTWSTPIVSGESPCPRHGHSFISIGEGKLALFGGANEDMIIDDSVSITRFNDLFFLDTNTLSWSRIDTKGSPPLARSFHGSALIGKTPKLLYIFAGETMQMTSDLTVLNLDTMIWKRPLFDCAFEHEMHSATEISGKMVIFGGLSYTAGLLNDFFLLNTVSIRGKENELTFKIVLAGDSGVGKSCLMSRFCDDVFEEKHASTIGLDFKTVNTMVDGKIIKLQIWDTAGQERFQSLTSHYYRGADGAVLVYDTCNRGSFERVRCWHDEIDNANTSTNQVLKLLVGNKMDLVNAREVSKAEGKQCGKKLNATFVETSACNSANVDVAFLNLARKLALKKYANVY